jgi:hypothetical protein
MSSWGRSACYPRSTFYPLSDGLPIQNHRITIPYFRTWSTCESHSQAPLAIALYIHDYHSCRGYLWKPPLPFRRRPPQSNYQPRTVLLRVRLQINKGWYFKADSTSPDENVSKSPTYPTHCFPKVNTKL